MSNQAQRLKLNHYPTQTWQEQNFHDGSTLSSPLPQDPPPQLPTSIHAVKDSNVPPEGRSIVICLDGTGDSFDNDNSNVVNFVACLKKDDPSQVTYYQSGIGTYDGQGLSGGFSAGIDMAIGSGLGVHIRDAYRFLMQNYREGDRICLLGFSRGSYTVRCLAGMLHKVGLLPAHNRAQVQFAYKFYKDDSKAGWDMSAGFKKTFCTNVQVCFVGVWDCVASVGFIPRKLPFSKSPTSTIQYFRHAMALDEHRAKFKICQWEHHDPAAKSKEVDSTPKARFRAERDIQRGKLRKLFGSCLGPNEDKKKQEEIAVDSETDSTTKIKKMQKSDRQRTLEKEFEKQDHATHDHVETDVLEVWFAGAHADVGGGAVLNHERHMLSRVPLRWMLRQCFECNTGILFSTAALAEAGIDVPTLWPVYKAPKQPIVGPSPSHVELYENKLSPPLSRRSTALGFDPKKRDSSAGQQNGNGEGYIDIHDFSPTKQYLQNTLNLLPEQVEDHFDALAPINDQLLQAKFWWVLELLWPVKVRVQRKEKADEEEYWEKVVRLNMGRYRAVRELEPKMHWSVKVRMGEKGYKLQNRVTVGAVWGVVA